MSDAHDGDVGAQEEYDADPALRELLTQAASSPTLHRDNANDVGDDDVAHRARVHDVAHRARVHDSAHWVLHQDADLFQRLKGEDDGDDVAPDLPAV